jgi:hypothetical protein
MNGKRNQLGGRSVISLLLAVLILAMAVAPALAEEDEGDDGYRPAQARAVMVNDEAMGYLSLKDRYPIPVTAETPAFVRVDDDAMGYMSLKGAYIVETPSERRALAIADDEGTGYLSLKVARLNQVTSGSPDLARAH